MVIRTFSRILTYSVLFEVHSLWLSVVSQVQCSDIELRGALVRGVGNAVLVACFKYLFYSFSVCCPHGLSLASRIYVTRVTGRVRCMSQMCEICGLQTLLFGGL